MDRLLRLLLPCSKRSPARVCCAPRGAGNRCGALDRAVVAFFPSFHIEAHWVEWAHHVCNCRLQQIMNFETVSLRCYIMRSTRSDPSSTNLYSSTVYQKRALHIRPAMKNFSFKTNQKSHDHKTEKIQTRLLPPRTTHEMVGLA